MGAWLAFAVALPATAAGDARSVIFQMPPTEASLEAMVIESSRDPEDRKKRVKPPAQRFREALEAQPRSSGLAAFEPGQAMPQGFDKYTPHGAVTAFRAGSGGFEH